MTDKKDGLDDMGLEGSAFEALERDFQEVLQDLVGDKSLERFKVEYEKLHRALKKSHDSEKRLIKKCRELNQEIVANAAKVQTALKLSQEDQNTIASLKKEIEKAWKMVDASHEKEQRAKETIQQLKLEITNLSRLVEQGAGLTLGQENTVNELTKQKDELTAERDNLTQQLVTARNEIVDLQEKCRTLDTEKQAYEADIMTLKEQINKSKSDVEREVRKKERLEKEIKEIKSSLEKKGEEVKAKQEAIAKGQEELQRLDTKIKEFEQTVQKAHKENDLLTQKTQKLQQDLEEQISTNTQLLAENAHRQIEIKSKEDEINRLRSAATKESRLKDGLLKKIKEVEQKKHDVEVQKEELKGQISKLVKESEIQQKQIEVDKKNIEDMAREKDLLQSNLKKTQTATQKQADLVKVQENTKKNLEAEIIGFKSEAQKQRKIIYSLEKEREKYGQQASDATAKYLEALEEVKIRQMTIIDLQKTIQEGEQKLKQQQALYEAVRSDRNLYSKNLIEAQDEIDEMKRKFKIMNHQIEQLKEEIQAKDHALVKEHFDHKKVDRELEALKNELTELRQKVQDGEETISGQASEINKLNKIISEADAERGAMKKEYDQVINERDILGTQLIRRNDELALLYEKIKIQQSTLNKGEVQYRERLEDIRMLKLKISDLKRKLGMLKQQTSNIDVLRNEVYHLQRELLSERTKVKALSEELENPMNVHRWRKLEGSDPGTLEMIQKIQTLQKRLIAKTEEVVEKDLLIQEKEKLYVELKNILARQPGPEVAEQLSIYQQNLREKTRQMKAMASELNMYQAQVNEYKFEIERLTRELQDVKRRYYEQKRREQLAKSTGERDSKGFPVHQAPGGQRFTGGGFSLSTG
uniref:Cilia- and flagella-associated protein 58 central coiled coil domain-containing protein n=1 Tax=Guillardia theta TaxID=55529 RepID=A0A7S4K395_GUITH|mmetsp:Transcript_20737/g.69275  ORF Transcript_20737/g.69275 Transcript_20737/m.69275 type:complete len:871 (+) Transcript_20737:104-2716(+)